MSAPHQHLSASGPATPPATVNTVADLEQLPNAGYDLKTPFADKPTLEALAEKFPTPFHLYDEVGIRANARAVREAFSWNPGYREYFAVKATPNPFVLDILREEGCGCDCASSCELMLADACGISGHNIMFSSNDTPAEDFVLADRLGAIINLDDISHVDFLERAIGHIP